MELTNLQRRLEASFRESLACGPELLAEVGKLEQDREALLEALKEISDLDPAVHSAEGFNEWGEAECFRLAQQRALIALALAAAEAPSTTQGR